MFDFVNTFRVGFYKRPFNIGLSRRAKMEKETLRRRHNIYPRAWIWTPQRATANTTHPSMAMGSRENCQFLFLKTYHILVD